jgi:hypothetical protein
MLQKMNAVRPHSFLDGASLCTPVDGSVPFA